MTHSKRSPRERWRRSATVRRLVVALAAVTCSLQMITPAEAQPLLGVPGKSGSAVAWTWPMRRHVLVREFVAPITTWGSGHRGIDLLTFHGARVRAPSQGIVSFVGHVGVRPLVVITHPDGLRSTLEPVVTTLKVGAAIAGGEILGHIASPHDIGDQGIASHCPPRACLHWGVREWEVDSGERYLDPLTLVRPGLPAAPVALLPIGSGLLAGVGEPTAQLQDRFGVHLTDPALGDSQDLTNLSQRKPLVVVEGHNDLLPLRQLVDRLGQQILRLF